jgi:prepilin-type processing-associated H-X9-DG protein
MSDTISKPGAWRRWRAWLGAFLIAFFLVWAGFVLLPSVKRTGVVENRVKCANNLRQIGLAISLYAGELHGEYPDSFGTLLLHQDIAASVFICSETTDIPADGPTTQAIADHLMDGGHMSYIYLGRGLKNGSVPDDVVIAYEPLSNHAGQGMNVLFGDGHVEFLDATQGVKIIVLAESTRRPVVLGTNP